MTTDQNQYVREYLANERTYLAYLRTSLALLSLGISINRFSLFLLERNKVPAASQMTQTLVGAEQLGIGMAILGLVLLGWGTVHYALIFRQISTQTYRPGTVAVWVLSGIVFVAALAGVGLLFTR